MPTPTCPHLERGTPHKGHSEGLQVPYKGGSLQEVHPAVHPKCEGTIQD